MASFIDLDTEQILSDNQQWIDLQLKWGEPVDLDCADTKDPGGRLVPATSTCILNRTTFDSAKIIKKCKRAKKSHSLDYDEFTDISSVSVVDDSFKKQFFFVGGNIFSKKSVEQICQDIDAMFKDFGSIRATSTVRESTRRNSKAVPEVVQNSVEISGLSFDDTVSSPRSNCQRSKSKISRSLEHVRSYIEALFRVCDAE